MTNFSTYQSHFSDIPQKNYNINNLINVFTFKKQVDLTKNVAMRRIESGIK